MNQNCPTIRILADHNNKYFRLREYDHEFRLQVDYFLAIGRRVMLCINLWTKGRSVRAAIIEVKFIPYSTEIRQLGLPHAVMVEFEDYYWLFLTQRIFPLTPISKSQN